MTPDPIPPPDKAMAEVMLNTDFHVVITCEVCHQRSVISKPLGELMETLTVTCPKCNRPTDYPFTFPGNA